MLLRGKKKNIEDMLGKDYPTRSSPSSRPAPRPHVLGSRGILLPWCSPHHKQEEDAELCATTFAPTRCQGSRLGAMRMLTGNVEELGLLPLGKSLQSLQQLHHGVLAA